MEKASLKNFGELLPIGGGDPIPLLKKRLRVGRREGCDIVLRFPNVSSVHCLLEIEEGYWFVKDLKSRNGVKVNGKRIVPSLRKRLDPGITIAIAKHQYEIRYEPHKLGAFGSPPQDEEMDTLFSQGLLQRAGLDRRKEKDD